MTTRNTLWLIDDDPALRLILEDTFNDAGLKVEVFSGAKGAWAKLNDVLHGHEDTSTLPDVILTDIRMPMMDGLSFSEWVHKNFPQLPIVIMTAHSDLKSAVDSYQTGAFEYLPKPFDLDDAITVIKKAIRPKQVANQSTEPQVKDTHVNQTLIDNNPQQRSDINLATQTNSDAKTNQPATSPNAKNIEVGNNKLANSKTKRSKEKVVSTSSSDVYVNETKQTVAIDSKPTSESKTKNKVSKPSALSKRQLADSNTTTQIIGQSLAMQAVFKAIGRLATSPITVLITGESGTGKELVASALHQHSLRRNKPFIALNMAAIPHDLIESELFGHEKGAFTGATTQRQGRFEQANGGTLFLDEIGDMPFSTQTRLLRVLANGEFFRIGGLKPIQVDVRIIAATHQNLEKLVREGKFREDLFYRLNVIRLPLPPLRARRDDIPELVDFFMERAAKELDTEQKQISNEAMQLMQAFNWPGNVRQIENACRWITVMATGDLVLIDDLPPELIEFARSYMDDQSKHPVQSNHQTDKSLAGYDPLSTPIATNLSFPTPHPSTEQQPLHTNEIALTTQQPEKLLAANHSSSQFDNHSARNLSYDNDDDHDSNLGSWQYLLEQWANRALKSGQTEILQTATPEFEKVLISVALKHSKGRKGEAADLLGWGRNTLTRKLKSLDID